MYLKSVRFLPNSDRLLYFSAKETTRNPEHYYIATAARKIKKIEKKREKRFATAC